jgi:hypothetical protein
MVIRSEVHSWLWAMEGTCCLFTEAIAVRALLQATLQQKCPKLVERGLALARTAQKFAAPNPSLRASRHYSNAPAGRGN